MRHSLCILVLSFATVACGSAVGDGDGEKKADAKGVEVRLDDLKSTTPASWKEETPSNKMRFAQFSLPRVKDDKTDAELVIFKGLGGSAKQNVERWKAQFVPPEGKKIDDVAKVEEIKIAGNEATLLDVSGTYKFKARPFDPAAKEELLPHYRMLAIHFEGPKNVYHIKLTGPAKTIEHYQKDFEKWVKSFK
jgi:hypothetical protein